MKNREVTSSEARANRIETGSKDRRNQESMPMRLSILEPIRYTKRQVSAEKKHPCNLSAPISEKPKGPSKNVNSAVISLDNGGCSALNLKTEKFPEAKPWT